jgi:predicted aspartyl protease
MLLLGCTALAAAAPAAQQQAAMPDPAAPAQASVETDVVALSAPGDHLLVDVAVIGQGPFPFMVDSGAERTVIARELAGQLALAEGKPVLVHSMTEARTIATARIPELRFSRKTVRDIHAPSLPKQHIRAAGVLGVDSLQQQRVLFDFEKREMAITPSSALQALEEDRTSDTVTVHGRSLYGRLVLTEASIDGKPVLAIVDTGSPITIANEALRRRLVAGRPSGPISKVELVSVTGGSIEIDYAKVRRVELGRLTVHDLSIGFGDVHPFRALKLTKRPAILLGMDVLRQFRRVTVDFPRRQVKFEMARQGGPLDS